MKNLRFTQLVIGVLSLLLASFQVLARDLTIAVASNFTATAENIISLFEQDTGHHVVMVSGATGKLYAQIKNGAPFEVFLAADKKHPLAAEQDGLAVPGTRFTYAKGKLVLWSIKPDRFSDGEAYVKEMLFAKIAIANPATAPYGEAAQEVLKHLGVWQQIKFKLIQGNDIAQVFQFAITGNVDAGFITFSQVKAWKNTYGSLWEIPQNYYKPIVQQAVLLQKGKSDSVAQAFIDFLKTPKVRQIITDNGYT
jgi:molybdate transport system substrate-binding protein